MTTAALVCEQAPVGKANANDLDRVSLKVTALPLPTVDPRIYPPALLSEDDLHILDSNYLSERTDASVNDDNNKNRPEAVEGQLSELKPASANGIALDTQRSPITSLSSITSTSTSAAAGSETVFPKKPSIPSKRNSKSKSFGKDDPRRERYLERNRRAASKCRRQKKERNQQLENLYRKLSAKHERLLSERDRMRSELLSLKDELLSHAQCEDLPLKLYIAQMVEEAGAAVAPTRPMSTYSVYSENQAQSFMFDHDDALQQQSSIIEMSAVSDTPDWDANLPAQLLYERRNLFPLHLRFPFGDQRSLIQFTETLGPAAFPGKTSMVREAGRRQLVPTAPAHHLARCLSDNLGRRCGRGRGDILVHCEGGWA
ncbi:hypothetical protein KXW63_008217, partial [Aspergillus fumigatus]